VTLWGAFTAKVQGVLNKGNMALSRWRGSKGPLFSAGWRVRSRSDAQWTSRTPVSSQRIDMKKQAPRGACFIIQADA